MRISTYRAAPILALALLAGCATRAVPGTPQADPIVRVAAALDKISIAAAAGTDVVILLRLPADQRNPVLQVLKKLVEARIAAGGIVRDLNKLDQVDKGRLGELLRPAFGAFRNDSTLALVGIKNPDSAAKVRLYLGYIDAAIAAITLALEWRQ